MRFLKKLFLFAFIYGSVNALHAQQADVSEVEHVIQKFFDGMRAADAEMIKNTVHQEATLHTAQRGKLVKTEVSQFIESVALSDAGSLDEQLSSLTIHTDGDLATAWMGYEFYYAGEFSHCGANSMNLLKTISGWKIYSIVDTRRTEEC